MRKNPIIRCLMLFAAVFILTGMAFAADVKITTRGGTIETGQTVNVTVSASSTAEIGAYRFTVTYDAAVIEYVPQSADMNFCNGGNGVLIFVDDVLAKSKSYTLKFKGKKAGTSKLGITAYDGEILDSDYNNMKVVKSEGSVVVNAPRQASTDCTLASLIVGQGKLSPAFNKKTLNYTISVGADVRALTLNAKATSPYAKVAVSGNNLKAGTNSVKILVTAESGAKATYTITVTKAEATPTPSPTATPIPTDTPTPTPGIKTKARVFEIDENGKAVEKQIELQLADKLSVAPPEDYQKEDANILGIMAEVYRQPENDIVLAELSDGQLYIYNSDDESFTLFRTMNPQKRNFRICLAPENEIPEGYHLYIEEIEGVSYPAYKKDDSSEFSLMYIDEGSWYSFDTREDTLQRYNEEKSEATPVPVSVTPVPATPMPVEPVETGTENAGEKVMPENESSGDKTATEQVATDENPDNEKNRKDKIKSVGKIAVVIAVFLLAITFMCLYVGERRKSYAIPEINEEEIKKAVVERINSEHADDKEESDKQEDEESGVSEADEASSSEESKTPGEEKALVSKADETINEPEAAETSETAETGKTEEISETEEADETEETK